MSQPESTVAISPDNRSKCAFCQNAIMKDTPRVDTYSRSGWHDGFDKRFVHMCCRSGSHTLRFAKLLRIEDFVSEAGDMRPAVSAADIKKLFTAAETEFNAKISDLKDQLAGLKPEQVQKILEANDVPNIDKRGDLMLHILADSLLNGLAAACPSCKKHALIFYGESSECAGQISAVTKCPYKLQAPPAREKFSLPDLVKEIKFFQDFKSSCPLVESAPFPGGPDMDPSVASDDEDDIPADKALLGMRFVFAGTLPVDRDELKTKIENAGGQVLAKLDDDVTHVISTESEVAKKKPLAIIKNALAKELPVVSSEFVDNIVDKKEVKLRQRKHLKAVLLGGGVGGKIPPVRALSGAAGAAGAGAGAASAAGANPKAGGKRKKGKEDEGAQAVVKKKKPAIPADAQILKIDSFASSLRDGNIYVDDNNTAYNAALSSTDIKTGVNKFYLIQLIQKGKSFYVFTRWGRVGDMSGHMGYSSWGWGGGKDSFQEKRFGSVSGAIEFFSEKFKKCTGNDWSEVSDDPTKFKQLPDRYNYVELEAGGQNDDANTAAAAGAGAAAAAAEAAGAAGGDGGDGDRPAKARKEKKSSTLDPRVQQFVRTIFDQDMMRKSMAEDNIDLKRMPLGSLSKRQMENGYAVLKEILDILDGRTAVLDDGHRRVLLQDATNRFYNVIPHVFHSSPPIIDSKEYLKKKLDLIETLVNISEANKLLKATESDQTDTDPTQLNYQKLKCNMDPLDKDDETYKLISEYLQNTHASTHNTYKLRINNIFRIKREGEEERFAKYASLHNRKLLWHGSRITNWVGILSQGLRIAPPEAPVTGYMFDKGIYLADMCSKSANYCFASRSAPNSVLVLCEAALGDQYERLASEYTAGSSCKAAGKHSTWGIGKTWPDPAKTTKILNDVQVPMGKGVPNPHGTGSVLLYNEFIVYDESQLAIRYLIDATSVF